MVIRFFRRFCTSALLLRRAFSCCLMSFCSLERLDCSPFIEALLYCAVFLAAVVFFLLRDDVLDDDFFLVAVVVVFFVWVVRLVCADIVDASTITRMMEKSRFI